MTIYKKSVYFALIVFIFVLLLGCQKAIPLTISEKWIPSYNEQPKSKIYFGKGFTPLQFGEVKLPENGKNEYWSPIEVPANISLSIYGSYNVEESISETTYSGKNTFSIPELKPEKMYLIRAKYVILSLGDLEGGLSFILYEYDNNKEGQWIRQQLLESEKIIENSRYH